MKGSVVFIGLFCLALFGCALAGDGLRCPTVLDGVADSLYDLSTQLSDNSIGARWFGLEKSEVLGYEWAIVSESRGMDLGEGCRTTPGFFGRPDVQDWTSVKKQYQASARGLNLVGGSTYYVVLRTTLSNGVQVYSNSNGIIVIPSELQEKFEAWKARKSMNSEAEPIDGVSSSSATYSSANCQIDQENRCRQSQESVREFLEQIYGPPVFNDVSQLALLYRYPTTVAIAAGAGVPPDELYGITSDKYDDDDDDDDDDFQDETSGIIAAVVVGVLLLLLLLLLLFALCGCLIIRGDDSDKFTERITERQSEDVDSAFGTSTTQELGSETTRVEFPDIDPHSRLSVAE